MADPPWKAGLSARADPEDFWADILSADPGRVRRAFDALPTDDALRVRAHLRRMSSETGWQAVQREHARAALAIIASETNATSPEDE